MDDYMKFAQFIDPGTESYEAILYFSFTHEGNEKNTTTTYYNMPPNTSCNSYSLYCHKPSTISSTT